MSTDLEPILRRDLTSIGRNWPTLTNLPRTPGGDKVDTTTASSTPLAISTLSLRWDCSYLLASWAHLVWDERRLTTGLDLLATVPITKFLKHHSRFLADHPARNDAVEEIGYYANQIVEVVTQTKAHKIPVGGTCPYCDGSLIAYLRNSDAPTPSNIRCTGLLTHEWTGDTEWHILDRMLNDRPVIVRYEDAARRLVAAITRL